MEKCIKKSAFSQGGKMTSDKENLKILQGKVKLTILNLIQEAGSIKHSDFFLPYDTDGKKMSKEEMLNRNDFAIRLIQNIDKEISLILSGKGEQ